MEKIEPFAEFLAKTTNARPEQFANELAAAAKRYGLSPERVAEEFELMKAYVLSYYEDVSPVCTVLSASGQPLDYVPFDQQPAVRAARAAGLPTHAIAPDPVPLVGDVPASTKPLPGDSGVPPPDTVSSAPLTATPANAHPIPQGTVPIPRISLERLVALGTLSNFFRKTAEPRATE